jgi:hypothetical protein
MNITATAAHGAVQERALTCSRLAWAFAVEQKTT